MKKEKELKTWEVITMFFLLIGLMFFVIYMSISYNKEVKMRVSCLEPYAISVCEDRQLEYSSNDFGVIYCKEDLRSASFERFYFNETEKEFCVKYAQDNKEEQR